MEAARASYRSAGRRARLALDPAERTVASDRIASHIAESRLWHAAARVGLYFAHGEEADLCLLFMQAWATGRRVYVPIVRASGIMRFAHLRRDATLSTNRYGIWEPDEPHSWLPARALDLVVTPLVAFDDRGNRIGTGAGYYDRCFSFLLHRTRWLHPKLVGAAFACQHVNAIPAAKWDVPLFAIATEHGLHRCSR